MKVAIKYILVCLVLFSGCGNQTSDGWRDLNEKVDEYKIEYQVEDKTKTINIYRLSPSDFTISIQNGDPKYISDWANEYDAEIVINGAYFNEDYSPSGYLKVNDERVGELIFDQNKSGLIQIDNDIFQIRNLAINPLETGESLDYGLQSFPFLIMDGKAAISEDSGKRARRTALGIDKSGNIYIIFVDLDHITLYELMGKLINAGIDFDYVLNLDGGPSSGLSIFGDNKDSVSKVPSVILFDEM